MIITIPENESLEPNSLHSRLNYNLMENRVGHQHLLGHVPLLLPFNVGISG